jgi:hypothetical protein
MSTLSISKFRAGLFAAVLAVVPFTPTAHAQDVGMMGQVNVPFAFETGAGHHFTAGVYTIRMENMHTLLIKGASDSALTMTTVEDNAQPAKSGKAMFRKYGNQYFLGEITIAGKSRRLYFQPSKAESRLQIGGNKNMPNTVELALLQTAR